jgi:GTPase
VCVCLIYLFLIYLFIYFHLFFIINQIDLCPTNVLKRTKKQLFRILRSKAAKKIPIIVKSQEDIQTALNDEIHRVTPVFWVSSVTGKNIDSLTSYLSQLKPRINYDAVRNKPIEFRVDETFNVQGVGTVISGTVASGIMKPNINLKLGPHADGSYKQVYVRSIHRKRVPVDYCPPGDSCALSVRPVKRKENLVRAAVRKGMVMIDAKLPQQATRWFEAEVLILHHPTTIKLRYQAVIHAGVCRQTACIDRINVECLRTGDKAQVRFKFMIRPEYIHAGTIFIFREGNTKGIGRITRVLTDAEAKAQDEEVEEKTVAVDGNDNNNNNNNKNSNNKKNVDLTANRTIPVK